VAGGPDGGPIEGEAVSDDDERDDYDDEPWRKRPDVAQWVHWPALFLGGFAVVQLLLSIAGCLWLPGAMVWKWIDPEFYDDDGPQWPEVIIGTLVFFCCVALNAFVIIGVRRMAKFRSYRLVLWAVGLSFLPLPLVSCGMVSVPLSIWALVVLLNRDVRARFEAVARGTMIEAPPETPDARTD